VGVVSITPQLLKLYGVSLFYPSRRLDNDLHHFFIQQRFRYFTGNTTW
jgi:hypothetical protein